MRRDSAITPTCIIYRCEATLWPRSAAVAALGRRVVSKCVCVCVSVCSRDEDACVPASSTLYPSSWLHGRMGAIGGREIVDFSRDDYTGGENF